MIDENEDYDAKFTIKVKTLSKYNDRINQTNKQTDSDTDKLANIYVGRKTKRHTYKQMHMQNYNGYTQIER